MAISQLTRPLTLKSISKPKFRYLGLLLAGILMGLWPIWPLAWIALVPLWWAVLRGVSLRQGALYALAWGVGYQGAMLEWGLHLHPLMWLGGPWLGSVAIATLAYGFVTLWCAGIVITWALGMAAFQQLVHAGKVGQVFVGTALWCGIEALWSMSPLYGTSLAITQSPGNLVILHLTQLSGHLAVTAAIVMVNGLLAVATIRPCSRRWGIAAAGVFAMVHIVGWSLYQHPLQDRPSEALTIGIVQGNIPSREKLTYQGIRQAEDLYRNSYRQLSENGADAVLTPEGAIPTVWKPESNIFSDVVKEVGTPLWLGTFTLVPTDKRHIHQSLIELTPNGITQKYNKIKLVPLGEYIPFQSVLGDFISRLSPIGTDMLPGKPTQQFQTSLGIAATGICYDSAYGWIFQRQVAQGGEFILTASNNDPYPPRMMAQHHGHDIIQAISTDRWAARSTNTGLSAVVDPHGQTQWMSTPATFNAQMETLYRRHTQTLYVRWGNWLVPMLLLISIGWVLRYQLVK